MSMKNSILLFLLGLISFLPLSAYENQQLLDSRLDFLEAYHTQEYGLMILRYTYQGSRRFLTLDFVRTGGSLRVLELTNDRNPVYPISFGVGPRGNIYLQFNLIRQSFYSDRLYDYSNLYLYRINPLGRSVQLSEIQDPNRQDFISPKYFFTQDYIYRYTSYYRGEMIHQMEKLDYSLSVIEEKTLDLPGYVVMPILSSDEDGFYALTDFDYGAVDYSDPDVRSGKRSYYAFDFKSFTGKSYTLYTGNNDRLIKDGDLFHLKALSRGDGGTVEITRYRIGEEELEPLSTWRLTNPSRPPFIVESWYNPIENKIYLSELASTSALHIHDYDLEMVLKVEGPDYHFFFTEEGKSYGVYQGQDGTIRVGELSF
jgi:hypothetical protein